MEPQPCTWWEGTGRSWVSLNADCPEGHPTREVIGWMTEDEAINWSDTARWPECCQTCGRPFDYHSDDQDISRSITRAAEFRSPASGDTVLVRDLPIGALFDCGYGTHEGPDGRYLVAVIPGKRRPTGVRTIDGVQVGVHHWHIDSRASNCGRPEDNTHHCWCRHGDPTQPETVHVDKSCDTCEAGAGSIGVPGFHGFLQHGHIVGDLQ